MKLRKILLYLVLFFAGFLTHALIFPDFLANGILFQPDTIFSNLGTQDKVSNQSTPQATHENIITFDGSRFSRSNITIPFTDYISIRNDSNEVQMWLSSDVSELTTTRGFAYKEQVRTRLDKEGQYHVMEKNGSNARLTITVKKK
jgi:hypothetical protein